MPNNTGQVHQEDFGWCPPDDQAIEYFSNNPTRLKTRISNFLAYAGTGTNIGVKWGATLLDPDAQEISSLLINSGEVEPEFTNLPSEYSDESRLKVMILMTDGETTLQRGPRAQYYNEESEIEFFAENHVPRGRRNAEFETTTSVANASLELRAICELAKAQGVIVYTIGFDISAGSTADDDMRACATSEGHYFDVDGDQLIVAFDAIAANIQQLKLVL